MNEYRDKLRSLSFQGAPQNQRTVQIMAEEGPNRGRVAAELTEHADGRVDATAFAPALTVETEVKETHS